ncbi:carboxylase [Longispora fulva]|uniref:Biotin carboxylase n=1 Tax=Longispora fulva TaxID=619741 RepID=A0A8J7GUV7_9ACTN|nr:ATP-grasp domain-containing protein [Longispora fulva]MBG6137836.1 biotin carboxylase [Longispora fulva]GIG60091.1 carboxylase [Longispora fulva]
MTDDRPLVLMLRTGTRASREFLLRTMAERYRLHLFTSFEPSWELPYLTGWTQHLTRDPEDTLAAARELHARDPISGVITYDEARVTQVAFVADGLGLPHAGLDAAAACRFKNLTRRALDAAGVPQPRSIPVTSLDEARVAAAEIGYPVVIKPHDLLAGMGVLRVDAPEELAERYADSTGNPVGGVPDYVYAPLVEECVTGEEISVDCALHGGELTVLCLARKENGFAPYFVEVGHTVDAADPLLTDPALLDVLRAAHAAIGYQDGITHTEIMLTESGPKIIEINGRMAGGHITRLAQLATGTDEGLAACDVACGRPPVPGTAPRRVAAVRFFSAEEETTIDSIRFAEDVLHPAVDETVITVSVGTVAHRPHGTGTGRLALAVAVADTAEECRTAIASAADALLINKD